MAAAAGEVRQRLLFETRLGTALRERGDRAVTAGGHSKDVTAALKKSAPIGKALYMQFQEIF